MVDRALAGDTVWFEDYPLTMHRNGYRKETRWQFSYSRIRGDEGEIVGMFNVASEMTSKVILERQLRAINADLEHCVIRRSRQEAGSTPAGLRSRSAPADHRGEHLDVVR